MKIQFVKEHAAFAVSQKLKGKGVLCTPSPLNSGLVEVNPAFGGNGSLAS
jgi:hypothetical protein